MWIVVGAAILSGVQTGNWAAVSAWSVVTHDVPDYAIVAGNPSHVVRRRSAKLRIEQLLDTTWSEWGPPALNALASDLCDLGADALLPKRARVAHG